MGRKPRIRTTPAQVLPVHRQRPSGIVAQTLALTRWQRLLLTAFFAIAATLLITPLVDNLYVAYFFSMDTRMVPTFVSTGFGILIYAVGYSLLIGHVGEVPPIRPATLCYLLAGFAGLGLVLALVIIGVYTNVLRG